MKIYKSDRAGKREFVREVISPLTIQTRSGCLGRGMKRTNTVNLFIC